MCVRVCVFHSPGAKGMLKIGTCVCERGREGVNVCVRMCVPKPRRYGDVENRHLCVCVCVRERVCKCMCAYVCVFMCVREEERGRRGG